MDKWEKSVTLIRLLKRHKNGVSLKTILSHCECSKPTFYRIKAYTESTFGVPVIFDTRYNLYRHDLPPDEELTVPQFWFKHDEIEAFILFSSMLQGIHGGFLQELLAPIRKRFIRLLKAQNITESQWNNRIKYCAVCSKLVDERLLKTAVAATVGRKRLRIKHFRFSEIETSERVVSPQKIVLYRDNWYLDAWCHEKNALRTFSIDRIVEIELCSTNALSIAEKELKEHFEQSYGIFSGPALKTAVIQFTPEIAHEISRQTWHPLQKITRNDDQSLLLEIPYANSRELIMDILRWGDRAKVLSPDCLKKEISDTITKMAQLYAKQ